MKILAGSPLTACHRVSPKLWLRIAEYIRKVSTLAVQASRSPVAQPFWVGCWWNSTKQTAMVIYGLMDYLVKSGIPSSARRLAANSK
jgi:hypothetical protein